MCRTCFSTVPSASQSWPAMPAFERPSAISASTSRSRAVRSESGSSPRRALTSVWTRPGSTTDPPAAIRRSDVDEFVHVQDATLEQVADPIPGREELRRLLDLDMCREDEDAGFRKLLADRVRCLEPLGRMRRRHPNVDDHELRLVLAHELEQLVRVARLADDLEVGPLEQAREPFAQKDVVVGHDDATAVVRLRFHDRPQPYAVAR